VNLQARLVVPLHSRDTQGLVDDGSCLRCVGNPKQLAADLGATVLLAPHYNPFTNEIESDQWDIVATQRVALEVKP
jgi:hypothetical protein